jgi:hypothetical protein
VCAGSGAWHDADHIEKKRDTPMNASAHWITMLHAAALCNTGMCCTAFWNQESGLLAAMCSCMLAEARKQQPHPRCHRCRYHLQAGSMTIIAMAPAQPSAARRHQQRCSAALESLTHPKLKTDMKSARGVISEPASLPARGFLFPNDISLLFSSSF